MAITSSAKKALRNSDRKRVFNMRRKKDIQNVTKEVKKLVAGNKIDEARALLPALYKALDKATKTKFIKKNVSARRKSRLTILVNKNSGDKKTS